MSKALAFIGGGQMATALAAGAVKSGMLAEDSLVFAEPFAAQREKLAQRFSAARIVKSANEALPLADRLVLSIKPQVLPAVCEELQRHGCAEYLVVSIAAGFSLVQLQNLLGSDRVVRVMPNTPAQVGRGAAGISAGVGASEADVAFVEQLMSAVGLSVRVPDSLMHAVTGLSGSGPAYVYLMIDALSDAGVVQGLPRDLATKLAAQTVLGAAQMVLESGLHPGQLRDQVTSPGGTTIAGLRVLEQAAVRSGFIEAVAAATTRSKELGQT
ncbi:MAG: pyrroline-5-carboxylate reductase [Pirellulaceae bacterium]|nr:pyrroline-5-carboxylate reductase [Pirellulaceae bacterium]